MQELRPNINSVIHMKAGLRPLGLFGEVALLHQHPNGTCRLNTQNCVYHTDSFVIFPETISCKRICHSLFYAKISQSLGSHQIIAQVFLQTFGGLFIQSVCFLYAITRLLSHKNNQYSAEKQLQQLFKYILPSIVKPRIALFFILRPVTYNHLENIAGQWISLSRNY